MMQRTRIRRVDCSRGIGILWAGLVGLFLISVACGSPPAETGPPHILLISVDALRADHLSCYGYDRHTTPVLDDLAARGRRYSKAFVNTHGTPPSHTTLLSSLYQESHRVGVASGSVAKKTVPSGVRMIQEILAEAGWHTLAVTGGGNMSSKLGFSRGFAEYDDSARDIRRGTEILVDRLQSLVGDGQPIFAFFHTYQVHSPYRPPDRFRGLFGDFESMIGHSSKSLLEIQANARKTLSQEDLDSLEALYDGEIRYADEVLGKLFSSLDEIGFLDQAVVVVTSDHGEEFGDHGGLLHRGTLFEELLHVPLIISGSGIDPGIVVPALVSHIDVAPTLLSLAGVETPSLMEGRDILSEMESESWEGQRVFAQYGTTLYSVRTPRWKLIHRPGTANTKLYDLHRDPTERRNLSGVLPDITAGLMDELDSWRADRPRLDLGEVHDVELSEADLEELRALGYVE